MSRKGELTSAMVDREWPYQVALRADLAGGSNYDIVHRANEELGGSARGHSVRHDGIGYSVFCFKTPEAAENFRVRFGGEPFDPKDRGKGLYWFRWNKPV